MGDVAQLPAGQAESANKRRLGRLAVEALEVASGVPRGENRQHKESLDSAQLERVNAWVDECEVGWIESDSVEGAKELEERLKSEFMPRLTKR